MKALQKHQAFEAEIMANKDLIQNVGKVFFTNINLYIYITKLFIFILHFVICFSSYILM